MNGRRAKHLRAQAKRIDPVHWKILYRGLKSDFKRAVREGLI